MKNLFSRIERSWLMSGFFLCLLLGVIPGCDRNEDRTSVDFSQTVPMNYTKLHPSETALLRVAIASMVSPRESELFYRRILKYIGERLGREIEAIQGKNYGEISELFQHGQADLGFIGSGPYATGKDNFGFDALAVPQIRGKPLNQAYLIVRKDSTIRTLQDLRGLAFAFTDMESFTGFIVPSYWLKQMKETPRDFFARVEYTHATDHSILAVTKGIVDGASINGYIWEYYNSRKPEYTSNTRIIKRLDFRGNPPIVAAREMPVPLKESIAQLLISMHLNPKGEDILAELMLERFVEPKESWYDAIRQMKHTIGQ